MKSSNRRLVVLFDIDYTLFDTRKFKESDLQVYNTYEEITNALVRIKDLASLGIFSKGNVEFQKTKLKKTGMISFFKEKDMHIFDDKDVNLINVLDRYKDSKLFLVDDKLSVLATAKKLMPQIIAVWVKRGPYAQIQKPIPGFAPDAEIKNLSEVVRIVQLKIRN